MRGPSPSEEIRADLVEYHQETKLSWHRHEGAVVVVNLSGYVREGVGGNELLGRPLQIGIKPPGIAHTDHFGPAGLRAIRISVPEAIHASLRHELPALSRWSWLENPAALRSFLRLLEPNGAPTHRFDLIMEGFAALRDATEDVHSGAGPSWVREAARQIDATVPAPPALSELAASAGVHPIYFARRFRRRFGCSVGTYARRRRIEMAADLMERSRRSLAEIAQLTGFADQPHLTRVFREQTGFSPARYRRGLASAGFCGSRQLRDSAAD
ncbi:MAG: helix-turn-helix transcriptional regulator [Gemmatimonadales bacterium]|nr:helix-turn-helix transcriptional regulator [Gemmatimonadales bacterium]